MAKILTKDQTEKIHEELTRACPLFYPWVFHTYYESAGESKRVHQSLVGREFWEAKYTFYLIVLAAEDELEGYPMEAADEQVS